MIQENRMADKLRQGAWLVRRGMWPTAAIREKDLQADTEQLRERIRDAQRSLEQAGSDEHLREALAAAEQLRQELESIERQQRRSPGGSENRDGQRGEQGSQAQGSQASGGQPGGEGSAGRAGGSPYGGQRDGRAGGLPPGRYRGEAWNPGNIRPWSPEEMSRRAPLSPEEQRQLDRQYSELIQEASGLRQLLSEDPEFDNLVEELVASMQNLDRGRFPGDPGELERLRAGLIDHWKELELRLSRQLQMDKSGAVRLTGLERIPERYRSILEEYYRSISRGER